MKKVIRMTWLKAITILYFLLITIFTSSAQQGNWEIGIGLRPLNLEDDPYSLILKRYVTPHFALRLGLGGMYKERDELVTYEHPYLDGVHIYSYRYTQVEKKMYASSFIGIQYLGTKRADLNKQRNFDWYITGDFSLKYRQIKVDLPNGVYYPQRNLQPGDVFVNAIYGTEEATLLGFRQGFGVSYWLNRATTINLESGFFYEFVTSKVQRNTSHAGRVAPPYDDIQGVGGTRYVPTIIKNYNLGFSPLTFFSIHHHF